MTTSIIINGHPWDALELERNITELRQKVQFEDDAGQRRFIYRWITEALAALQSNSGILGPEYTFKANVP